MDAPKPKPNLLSDVHVGPRNVHIERAPQPVEHRLVLTGKRPVPVTHAYARFYRAPADVLAAKVVKREVVPQERTLALQAVAQARSAPTEPERKDFAVIAKRKKVKHNQLVHRTANILLAFTIIMSGIMGVMVYRYHLALQKVEAMPLQAAVDSADPNATATDPAPAAGNKPSEAPLAKGGSGGPRLAPGTPYKISIPKLKVSSTIISVGLTKAGAMNVPGNIWQAGWYKTSAKPSDNTGVVVINGHVHGPTLPGIFANLTKLQAGDAIAITDAGGTTYNYKVDSSQSYKAGDANENLMQSASPTKQGLNLVTCTGAIKGSEYQDRLVVFAERV